MERYNYEQDESYIKRLWEYIDKLEEENKTLKKELHNTQLLLKTWMDDYMELEEENKKLREFKAKQEEMMFLIWASIELAKPKTAWDADKLQKGKEIYEKLYKEELYYLREENKNLKEKNKRLNEVYEVCNIDSINRTFKVANLEMENEKLKEELKWYKKQYEHSMGED